MAAPNIVFVAGTEKNGRNVLGIINGIVSWDEYFFKAYKNRYFLYMRFWKTLKTISAHTESTDQNV